MRRQVPLVCLVGSHTVVSQRRRCGAAGSHPEGEPPVGSTDPFDLMAAQVVAAAPGVVVGLLRPTHLQHLPCRLLLVLLLAMSLLVVGPE